MAHHHVLAMLLTTKYVDGLPLYRFEKLLGRHGVDIPRQTLARWVIHCDETRVQVLREPDRDPTSQPWMWVQASGPPERPVVLFDYTTSHAQEVPLRLLADYRGYLMTDDYAGYNALGARSPVSSVWAAGHMRDVSSSMRKKCSPRVRPGEPTSR